MIFLHLRTVLYGVTLAEHEVGGTTSANCGTELSTTAGTDICACAINSSDAMLLRSLCCQR